MLQIRGSNTHFLHPKGKGNTTTAATRRCLRGLQGAAFPTSHVGTAGATAALHTGEPCDPISATRSLVLGAPPHGECRELPWVQRAAR